jgi:rhodanese-related sulfurtransferase
MNRFLLRAMAVMLYSSIFLLSAQSVFSFQKIEKISKEELVLLLDKSDVNIIDVRMGRDWKKSDQKIKGAVREDPYEIETWAKKYSKDNTIVIYCA